MMAICIIMYMVSTAHWAVIVGWWCETSTTLQESLLSGITVSLIHESAACSSVITPYPQNLQWAHSIPLPTCALMALLTVNVILSDAIVLFRASVLAGTNQVVRPVSILLFSLLFGLSVWNSYSTCATRSGTASVCSFCSTSGVIMVVTSLALNVWATGIVGCKALQFKRTVKTHLTHPETSRLRPEKMLSIIIDSGVLYCALWTVVMIGEFIEPLSDAIIISLQESSLIQLVGMYPTILVAVASFDRLRGDRPVRALHPSAGSRQFSALSPSSVQRTISGQPSGQARVVIDLDTAHETSEARKQLSVVR
ncbi:hypothetical protein BC629DRAFT_397177 [Irpex lacteus]|nr:hypothetical protein BC629DRAFT_397177 [Irpex lacteus]